MRALWETEDIGRRLLGAWDGEGCVFLVFKRYEVFLELERLNGSSMCRWLPPLPPRRDSGNGNDQGNDHANDYYGNDNRNANGDDDDARSTSTIRTDGAAPGVGAVCLGAPQFLYEKAAAGLPACFLFGRRAAVRRADVLLGRGSKDGVSRIHFALGLKRDTWAVCAMSGAKTTVNQYTTLVSGTPGFALVPGRGNSIQLADIEFEIYCREPRVAAQYLADGRTLPPSLPPDGAVSSSASSRLTVGTAQGAQPAPGEQGVRYYVLQHEPLESRTDTEKFLALDAWTCARYAAKQYMREQEPALRQHLSLLDALPVSLPDLTRAARKLLISHSHISYRRLLCARRSSMTRPTRYSCSRVIGKMSAPWMRSARWPRSSSLAECSVPC